MADVVRPTSVLRQVGLVAGLRWRTLKNGLRRKNNRWDLIGMVFAGFFSALLVLGVSAGVFAGVAALLSSNRARWIPLFYWGIFVWWQVLPVFAAGFGATFEFRSLLRFPLRPRAFYVLGLAYGLADFGALSSICWIIAMLSAALVTKASILPTMLVVSALFVLFNATLERLLGSWLEKLLAKRKARELFLAAFVLSMVSLNFLNPAFQQYGKSIPSHFKQIVPYFAWLPGSLAGRAVAASAIGDYRGVFIGMIGLSCWLVGVSAFLWSRYSAQYRGEENSESSAPAVAKRRERRQATTLGVTDFLPGSVAAVVVKEFRYLTRNGFALLSLVLPPFMVLLFSAQFAGSHSMLKQHGLSPELFYPAIIAYLILILVSPAYNSFAYEGKGIQTYFMVPATFREVLMGKNLFLILLVTFELSLSIGILVWRIGWPTPARFVATVMAAVFALVGQLAIANWSSLSFPKKMEIGKMKGQRNSGIAVWTAFGVQIVLGGICAAILFTGQWTNNPWLPAFAFAGLSAAALGGYFASLRSMDSLAARKKELLIETFCR